MKKNILHLLIIGALVVGAALPAVASAATVRLSGIPASVSNGGVFTVNVFIDPQNAIIYTAKIALNFSAGIFSVRGFSFADATLPLAQKGYDSIDNTNGTLIKTAGFPGGINSEKLFGTITFYAKSVGAGVIGVDASNSLLLNKTNQNIYSGSSGGGETTVSAPASVGGNGVTSETKPNRVALAPSVSTGKGKTPPLLPVKTDSALVPAPRLSFALLALAYALYPFSNVAILLVLVATLLGCVAVLYGDKRSIGHKKVGYVMRMHVLKKIKNKSH